MSADTMNRSEVKLGTPEHSDPEGDTFEDAQDGVKNSPSVSMSRQRSSTSTRSLTERSNSRQSPRPNSGSSNLSSQSPAPADDPPRSAPAEESADDQKTPRQPKKLGNLLSRFEGQNDAPKKPTKGGKGTQKQSQKSANKSRESATADERAPPAEQEAPVAEQAPAAKPATPEPATPKPTAPAEGSAVVAPQPERVVQSDSEPEPQPEQEPEAEPEPEATEDVPLATPKPPNPATASFQEVALGGNENSEAHDTDVEITEAQEDRGRKLDQESPQHSPKSTATSKSRSTSRVPSISEKVAASGFSLGSWGASAKTANSNAAAPSKKMSAPWGWLSRKKTTPDSPPTVSQRNSSNATGANGVTSTSNRPDLKLRKLDDEPLPARDQLKERFKLARMKEEAGITPEEIAATPRGSVTSGGNEASGTDSRRTSDTGEISSPISMASKSEVAASPIAEPTKRGHKPRAASMAQSISVDPKLAPGMVSGLNQGPSSMADPEAPVDWDLWQSVVYEGPSAVAKTSATELSHNIANGIPNPIRGVVWQVLAQSKSEELERKYHELVARGTEKEMVTSPTDLNPPLSAKSHASNNPQKEPLASSASSIHTEASGLASPVSEQELDPMKVQAEREKKKKEKETALKKLEKTIRKDLGARSNYSKYFAAKEMQDDLFGVCKAYALYDEEVGYAQGMNFIVMPLLFNMPAEEAFCLLVRLMHQYKLRDTFTQEMPGLHRALYQFERILEETDTKLCRHLSRKGITPSLYATQWFITLFAYKFPLQLVLRVYDLLLSESLESAILKFGIALMQKNSEKLMAIQDMAALKTFLNERLFDVYIDSSPSSHSILEQGFFGSSGGSEKDVYRADLLVQDACAVSIPGETLKAYADEYDSKTKAEKERQVELEDLRKNVGSQAVKIRSLEERVEKSDTEHVQITQEMIRSRMENEELKTASMEQLAEIENLKKQVADAPEQVETSLKEEMERIMARNTEVQSQNRMLEEQMADMEKSLVETKMQFAQINGDYETLKQKWSDLRRALGD